MKTPPKGDGSLATETAEILSIRHRAGVWRIERNKAFYGDYPRKYLALEAAFEEADAIVSQGRNAVITMTTPRQTNAIIYDTRPKPTERASRKQPPPKGQGFWTVLRRLFEKPGLKDASPLNAGG